MSIFQTLIDRASAADIQTTSKDSINWFRNEAMRTGAVNQSRLMREERAQLVPRLTTRSVGRMYMFFYDPKHKDTLPYYDRFPLIFPFKMTPDGFYGLNLHYIFPMLRAKLMDAFLDITNNKAFDDTTKLRLSYDLLNASSRYKYFKPCVKRYLNNHVTSRFLYVDPSKWTMALFLPTEKFANANKLDVFADSNKIIYGR
jgi:hypothetical protein